MSPNIFMYIYIYIYVYIFLCLRKHSDIYLGTLAIGGKPDEIRGRMLRISNCQRLRGKKLNIRSLTVGLLNWACKVK